MRPQGSPAELERRRLRAIELLQRDIPVHVVAERLGSIGAPSVAGSGRIGDRAAWGCVPAQRVGSATEAHVQQRQRLTRLVIAGLEAAGYRTSLWTCRRIVELLRWRTDYGMRSA